MVRKYRPSNGTEGHYFMEAWCFQCQRDTDEGCPILADTFCFEVTDERYPSEWQYADSPDSSGLDYGICTEYIPLGDPVYPMQRDKDPAQEELPL